MKTRNFFIAILFSLLVSVLLGYGVFWHVLARQIETGVRDIYDSAGKAGIVIEGRFPQISGFPFKHRLSFSGKIHTDGYVSVNIPQMEMTAFPLPGQMLEITFPQGLSVSSDASPMDGPAVDGDVWSLGYLSVTGPIPETIPAAATVESLRAWRDGGGAAVISSFEARKESLNVSGYGQIRLDNELQPAGYANVVMKGQVAFLGYLESKKLIDPKQSLITSSVLNGLSSQDEASGERFLKASLTVQNRKLLVGPIPVITFPAIEWPYAKVPLSVIE